MVNYVGMASAINSERVHHLLEELASEKEQRRLWLSNGANGADVSSFVEAFECLFTDTLLDRELERGRIVFNKQIDAMFSKLGVMLSQIDANRPPDQIIADVKMREVRLFAAQLLRLLRILQANQRDDDPAAR